MKRPLFAGLGLRAWVGAGVLLVPGYLKRLTVAYYLQPLVMHEMPEDGPASALMRTFPEIPPPSTSLVGLALIVGLGLWLAGRTVERREYVLEQ